MTSYRNISPVIQSQWYTCWAAIMSWWTLAMQDRGRGFMSEQDILDKFPFSWDKNGAMTLKGLYDIFKTPKFMMKLLGMIFIFILRFEINITDHFAFESLLLFLNRVL